MISLPGIFGFPPPEKRDGVRFLVAKSFPYNLRIFLALVLLAAGFVLQLLFLKPLYGAPFILAGVVLVLVKGYDSRVRLKSFSPDSQWTTVTIEKIQEIESLRRRSSKWDRDALDVSNALGVFSFLFFAALAVALSFWLGSLAKDNRVTTILLTDAALLVVPLWMTGMRYILKQPNLAIRVDIILNLFEEFQSLKEEGETFKPALMLAGKGKNGTVPVDARFSIAFPESPEGFYGLQAQINLNVVQGNSYPYFYCVLAAKPGFGLSAFKDKMALSKDVICEFQKDGRAEVLVIRQKTTRKSGYHTKDRRCAEILMDTIQAGRQIVQAKSAVSG
jgi:hypothetical protein